MSAAHRMLWQKFEELVFDAPSTPQEADNIDVGPVTEADLHDDLFFPSDAPFWKSVRGLKLQFNC
jgi:hypothetical protein